MSSEQIGFSGQIVVDHFDVFARHVEPAFTEATKVGHPRGPQTYDGDDARKGALDTGVAYTAEYRGRPMESTHGAAARRPDPKLELIQSEHELARAYDAARTLRERLELAGLNDAAAAVKRIQDDIFRTQLTRCDEMHNVDIGVAQQRDKLIVDGPPCQGWQDGLA